MAELPKEGAFGMLGLSFFVTFACKGEAKACRYEQEVI
jgi:hypothetical protein